MSPLHRNRGFAVVLTIALLGLVPLGTPAATADTPARLHSAGMVDTDTGIWYLRDPLRGAVTFFYGDPGDRPFLGDWDCDGVETPGLYRQSDGFAYLRNSNTQGNADITFFFGDPADVPLAGDFDGDGCDTVSVYRPSEARFYVINELGTDGGGLGAADFSFVFGDLGDAPFVGDFDGDGVDSFGLHRVATGRVYFRNDLSAGNADLDYIYGDPNDVMLAGDWDGDGDDSLGVFRPSTMEFFFRNSNTPGRGEATWHFRDAARTVFSAKPPGGALANLVGVAGATGLAGEVPFTEYGCPEFGDPAQAFGVVATSPAPAVTSDADGVVGMSYQESPLCERFVITLGTFGAGYTGKPANTVPEGVVVENFGHRNHVTMPGMTKAAVGPRGIDHYEGVDHRNGPEAFFVSLLAVPADIYADVHYPSNRFTEVTFLSDPARIVLDTHPAPTGTGLALGPVATATDVIRDTLDPDLLLPGIRPPIEVVGYGIGYFEGTAVITLSDADTGAPAVATFSGPTYGTVTGSGYLQQINDFPVWGEFRFTIEAIEPGEYEINIASDTGISPEEGDPPEGVSDTFPVVP